ncbi:uncharacterized protein LOC103502061 [Cucumis melo]|uniref:Uncharacterized protein LOC103502061 n=1 Tax=Cucumis melo TaxID=3656 RepID=A0ABM3KD12_CUCME|nr:uncharacterized protein LOC103502061 [Cucumis melo]
MQGFLYLVDSLREGSSTTRPPVLDGANYAYWKARIIAFIKSIDSKCWKAMIAGLKHPSPKDVAGKETLKQEITWSKDKDEAAFGNSRALNAIFNGVDQNIFKWINTCLFAKEAWNILETAYEGTSKVKISKLQILSSKFEAVKLIEDETIVEFNVRVLDLANESFALSEKLTNTKQVRKVQRSLPPRFNMKVTTIEEANDILVIRLDELFDSLRTFELSLDLHLLIRESVRKRQSLPQRSPSSIVGSRRKDSYQNTDQIDKSVRCHECEGFRHHQAEYAIYLKRKKKGLAITLSGRALISCEQEISNDNNLIVGSEEKRELDSEKLPSSGEKLVKEKVIGKGHIDRSGTPNLRDVKLVKGRSSKYSMPYTQLDYSSSWNCVYKLSAMEGS